MPKPSSKTPAKKQPPKDARQPARSKIDAVAPAAEPTKPAANKAKPPKPVKKQDVKDIDRADAEGMGQPQGIPRQRKPAAAAKKAAKRR